MSTLKGLCIGMLLLTDGVLFLAQQTWPPDQGGGPPEALNTGWNDGPLSYLPGQRLSACTCPGEDHPGPWLEKEGRYRGRASPELDVSCGQEETTVTAPCQV